MAITAAIGTWIDTLLPGIRARSIVSSPSFNSRPGIGYVQLSQSIVRYRVSGNGSQTLVLATDPPVTIEHYDELLLLLEKDFRVIIFEVPGFGFSLPNNAFHFEFYQSNDLVAEFLQRLDMGPYLLAFPCVSAYGAIDIANRFPNLVKGVVLIQAPSWNEEVKWKHGRDRQGILSTPIIGQLALLLFKRQRVPQWFEAALGNQLLLQQFIETANNALAHGACFCLASAFQNYLTDESPPLAVVNQPTLLIWGQSDRSHRKTNKLSTKQYAPQAQEVWFEKAGHFPELEEPELFVKNVNEWARSLE